MQFTKRWAAAIVAALITGSVLPPQPGQAATALQPGALDYARQVMYDKPSVYYRMNETSGSVFTDISGNNLDAAIGSNIVPGNGLGQGPAGENLKRAFFPFANNNGAGAGNSANFVSVPDSSVYKSNAFTIEALITLPGNPFTLSGSFGATGSHEIASVGMPGVGYPNFAWDLSVASINGTNYKATVNLVRGARGVNSVGELYAGSTALVAGVWDGVSTMRIYVNGVEANNRVLTGGDTAPTTGFGPMRIGAPQLFSSGTESWDGSMSEVAMYDHEVLPARLLAHAQAWKGQTNTVNAVATGNVGATELPVHGLYAYNLTTEYANTFNSYSPSDWAIISQLVDMSPRTDVNSNFVSNQRGNGIRIGTYVDAHRSCSTSTQGGIICGGINITGPNGRSFANADSLQYNSVLHTCDGSSRIYWNNQNDGHNTINDPTGTLADDYNALVAPTHLRFGYDFATLDNGVEPLNLVNNNGAGFRINDPKGTLNPLQGPLAGAYGLTPTAFACMARDPLGLVGAGQPVLYSSARYVQGYSDFISKIKVAGFQNWSDADPKWFPLLRLPNLYGFWHENSYGGGVINNESFFYQSASGALEAAKRGKVYVDFDHTFDGPRTNAIQTTRAAMAALMYEYGSTGLQTDAGTSPVPFFVPMDPEVPTANVRSLDDLREGDVWIRRFKRCGVSGVNVGRCAAIVFPTNNAKVPPSVVGYSKVLNVDNYVSGTTYKGSLTPPLTNLAGLTGTVSATTATTPTTGNYLTGVIVIQ